VQFRSSAALSENRDRIIATLQRLAAQNVKVAVFPECALTGYDQASVTSPTAQAIADAEEHIRNACRNHKIGVVLGSVFRTKERLYNTAVAIDSSGELRERYAKVMLANERWFTPGNHIAFFDLEGIPSTIIICHDQRYPELVRLPAIQRARVI
jgi:predicted amidohydrolase